MTGQDPAPRSTDTTTPTQRRRRWAVPVATGVLAGSVLLAGGVAHAAGNPGDGSAAATVSPPSAGAPAGGPGDAGSTATPPTGTPTPPAAGSTSQADVPTPPEGAPAPPPAPPAGAPAPPRGAPVPPAAAGDRIVGTLTAVSDSSLTVTDDQGAEHQLTRNGDTRVAAGPDEDAGALATGDRVEVRAQDGTAMEVHRLLAHVDGVVTAVDGDELTVVTPPGLHVVVDAAGLDDVPSVGDHVHLVGTVDGDGTTVVATRSVPAPR